MLRANNIDFSLDRQLILKDIHLEINKGELVGLIGPNGAGKSSLLRILAGLCEPDRGDVIVQQATAKPLASFTPLARARLLAYLGQQEKPVWPLAVEHLVGLGRAPWSKGFSEQGEHEAVIARALALTELTHLIGRPVNSLSGGELQRVLLARVFAGEPEIIIADEPIAALDPYHQLHIMELLRNHAEQGGTVVAALHDLSLAARFCHHLILLHHGQVYATGTPAQVLTPENLHRVYGITAHVDCRDDGVVIIPQQRVTS
jgi:ABC-type cobalamin/Fe3+-siderophores transport system ATPase subunit